MKKKKSHGLNTVQTMTPTAFSLSEWDTVNALKSSTHNSSSWLFLKVFPDCKIISDKLMLARTNSNEKMIRAANSHSLSARIMGLLCRSHQLSAQARETNSWAAGNLGALTGHDLLSLAV